MSIVSALVLFAVVWFLTLFVVLPIRLKTQGDVGERVEGTQAGAPATGFSMKRKALVTTYVAIPVWGVLAAIILFSGLTVQDLDIFRSLRPSG